VGRSSEKVSFELGVIERELRMVRAVNRRRRKLFVGQSFREKRRVSDGETDCLGEQLTWTSCSTAVFAQKRDHPSCFTQICRAGERRNGDEGTSQQLRSANSIFSYGE